MGWNLLYNNSVNLPFLNKFLSKNKNVLVHCYAGKQRSACVISAYLLKYTHMTPKDTILAIKSKRLITFTPKINFDKAIKKYYQYILETRSTK